MGYILLMLEFMKIGLFAVGGGTATIPFLMELMNKYHWYTEKEFTNLIAISQSTPGPVGVNMATYSGYLVNGVLGGILATFALVAPSVVIIIAIVRFLNNFSDNKIVKSIFSVLRPAVTGLLATSVFGIIKMTIFEKIEGKSVLNIWAFLLFAFFFVLMQIKGLKDLHPAIWMLISAIIGVFVF